MAHRYVSMTGKEFKAGSLSFTAVAEDEITSMFDCLEDCALTAVSVIVKDEKDEQVASFEYLTTFYFSADADAFDFAFGPDVEPIAMAAHDWDPDKTTGDDVEALETAAGGPGAFWEAADAAAADVCRRLEDDVRALAGQRVSPADR